MNLRRRQSVSAIQARKLLANWCIDYLANIADGSKYEKLTIDRVPIAREFCEVFRDDLIS